MGQRAGAAVLFAVEAGIEKFAAFRIAVGVGVELRADPADVVAEQAAQLLFSLVPK